VYPPEQEFDAMATSTEERVDRLETALGEFITQTGAAFLRMERSISALQKEMVSFKDEMRADRVAAREEMASFRDEMRTDRIALNKKWGELANKLGTFAEDIAAPNVLTVARNRFALTEPEFFAVRLKRRHPGDTARTVELDAIAAYPDAVLINETKSTPRRDDVEVYRALVDSLLEFFPEYQGRRLIPIFSSITLRDEVVATLTQHRIYGMAMTGDTMDLVNFEAVSSGEGRREP
jgi:hypothetical protein